MCGRVTLFSAYERLQALFGFANAAPYAPRYNIAPTQPLLVVRGAAGGGREAAAVPWGVVPLRAGTPARPVINARGETIRGKPLFRRAIVTGRCLVPADGFYEWQAAGRPKQPWFIRMADARPFAIAGLCVGGAQGGDPRCVLITTAANALMAPIHNRMPVILAAGDWDAWLAPGTGVLDALKRLFEPCPADRMAAHPVGPGVNNPRNDAPELIKAKGERRTERRGEEAGSGAQLELW